MKPCDVKTYQDELQLIDKSITCNNNTIGIDMQFVILTIGPARLIIPQDVFNTLVEWYTSNQVIPEDRKCPDCGAMLIAGLGGGVKCSICSYWFCY